jgi:hypothetical protein
MTGWIVVGVGLVGVAAFIAAGTLAVWAYGGARR